MRLTRSVTNQLNCWRLPIGIDKARVGYHCARYRLFKFIATLKYIPAQGHW